MPKRRAAVANVNSEPASPPTRFLWPRLRRDLIAWYAQYARNLPWRRTGDAYRVWVSEVMLQQTTVTAVVPYFERFLQRFPTVNALATAPEADVLRLWEGLGYYSRARNLHKAAQQVVLNGEAFPRSIDELMSLPGVGRYTAGAIASFAYDVRAPIVEANTLRLYARLLGMTQDPRSKSGQALLWQFAEEVLPATQVGQFNQALMDLGSLVCTPRDPLCHSCPLQTHCQAFATGQQATIPLAKKKTQFTDLIDVTAVVEKGGMWLLRQHPSHERWAGLWDFPRATLPDDLVSNPHQTGQLGEFLVNEVRQQTGITVTLGEQFTEIRHAVTRYRIQLRVFAGGFESGRLRAPGTFAEWVAPGSLANYPLTTTARQIANLRSAAT